MRDTYGKKFQAQFFENGYNTYEYDEWNMYADQDLEKHEDIFDRMILNASHYK